MNKRDQDHDEKKTQRQLTWANESPPILDWQFWILDGTKPGLLHVGDSFVG